MKNGYRVEYCLGCNSKKKICDGVCTMGYTHNSDCLCDKYPKKYSDMTVEDVKEYDQ